MVKVAVVGAAGGIGQPLSLLLKLNPTIAELVLYDVVPLVAGVAADLSHIDTPAKITFFTGTGEGVMQQALTGCDIVVIPAGVPRKPGMTRDDLFNINAGIIKGIAVASGEVCPEAFICVVTNPVNSTVPVYAETLSRAGKFNPKKLFGISTLDVLRANTFIAEAKDLKPQETNITVIGGHSGATILPVLSASGLSFTDEELEKLTDRIQNGGTEVVNAKAGAGSATLSMAQAANRFVNSLLKAMKGELVTECTYVKSDLIPNLEYFASPVVIGKDGIVEYLPLPKLSAFEQGKFDTGVVGELTSNIHTGLEFARK